MLFCSKRSHYSALGLCASDLSKLPPLLLQLLEVSMRGTSDIQIIAAARFAGESVSNLSRVTNMELKTVHLYVRMFQIL